MGVTIGKHSVVAGVAVVNRDIPDFSFAAGVPAVVKRSLR
jgi:maltose O-acetyltransferase